MSQTKILNTIYLVAASMLAVAVFLVAVFFISTPAAAQQKECSTSDVVVGGCVEGEPKKDKDKKKKEIKPKTSEKCGNKGGPGNKGVPIAVKVNCSNHANPIYAYASGLIRFLALGVGIVIVGAIIFGGIAYASARGDQAQTKKAIEIITNAGIALIMFLLMAAILNFIIPGGLL